MTVHDDGSKTHAIIVRDNFNYMDPSEQYRQGEYYTYEEAVTVCRDIVDSLFSDNFEAGMSADKLFDIYVGFGEDPFIVGPDEWFSAWTYAKKRCGEICVTS